MGSGPKAGKGGTQSANMETLKHEPWTPSSCVLEIVLMSHANAANGAPKLASNR